MAPVLGRQTKLFNILYFTEYIMKSLVWRPRTGAPEQYKNSKKIFTFLNTVFEEQFCIATANAKFHTIFH